MTNKIIKAYDKFTDVPIEKRISITKIKEERWAREVGVKSLHLTYRSEK